MKRKNRKQLALEYDQKYSEVPRDYNERLEWMYDKYKVSEKKAEEIVTKRNQMIDSLYYTDLVVILYEIGAASPRPRFRLVNRKNLVNEAMSNGQFVHVYSLTGKEDNIHMKRLVDNDLINLSNIIYTPCIVTYDIYMPTPAGFNVVDKFLAEIGLVRHIFKPDWDNLGKKYSDMYNGNVWIDDNLVIDGTVRKFYSELPRIEIRLRFLNMLYNKYQYNSMIKKTDQEVKYFKEDK